MQHTPKSPAPKRRPLKASSLLVELVELNGVTRKFAACPACRSMTQIKRHQLVSHRAEDGISPCSGSQQPIVDDLDAAAWAARYDEAVRHVASTIRRPPRTHVKPEPPIPAPLHRIRATSSGGTQ